MKIGLLKNRNQFGHIPREDQDTYNYTHLIIENSNDVLLYNDILAHKNANDNTELWFGFKSQNFRNTISDYMIHETKPTPESKLLAFKLDHKETDTSLLEYCEMSDNIVSDKCASILKYINQGKTVRINKMGGYCFIDDNDINNYDELFEPTVQELNNFIYFGELKKDKIKITKSSVIIENGTYVSDSFKEKLKDLGIDECDELLDFKRNIRIYTDEDIVKIFVDGVKNGLKNICFETTGQDLHQVRKMKELLDNVVKLTKTDITLYIESYNKKVFDIFNDYKIITK